MAINADVRRLIAGAEQELAADPHNPDALRMLSDLVEEGLGDRSAADRLRVRAEMGKNYLGPEALALIGARDVGEVPPLPSALTPSLLRQPCPITRDGRTIAETHRLVFVPRQADGEPFTLLWLHGRTAHLFPRGADDRGPV